MPNGGTNRHASESNRMGTVNMVGLSSLFLFSVLTVVLCEKTKEMQTVLSSVSVWCLGCMLFAVYGEKISFLLFEVIPFTAHIVMFAFCFGLFIILERLEKDMLTLVNISKNYGNRTAVKDINLNMECGLYGMLAPNGAGKTTIIKMITTLLLPTSGEILYNGTNIWSMGAAYRDVIGYLPQQFGYYKNNTPMQYLEYLACLKKMPRENMKKRIGELLELVGLSDEAHTKMKKFSGGMIQRVGIAQAMLNDPKILILDEPTAGLDPKERVRFRNIISMLSKDRIVILSTHIVSDIESIANQVILIKDRQLYKMDTVPNICASLDGRIYEIEVSDAEYEAFGEEHQVLAARQENGKLVVRFYERGEQCPEHATLCNANLEDVFLVTYQ